MMVAILGCEGIKVLWLSPDSDLGQLIDERKVVCLQAVVNP
jgi:hypothetical protein